MPTRDFPPDDPVYTRLADEDILRVALTDPDPERHAPAPRTHCPVCGKPLDAQLTCVACGDETEQEAA